MLIEYPEALLNKIQPGKKVKIFYRGTDAKNETRHIRAIVDEDQVVYRVWTQHKNRWSYRVGWVYDFLLCHNSGILQ